jgi:UDP-N-acetylglucosamine 2-epimerase (non-hydrolysing)
MLDRPREQAKHILCLVGTRPESIKMAPVIRALKQTEWARVTVVSTGQHRELVHQILGLFDISVDYNLDVMQPDQTLSGLSSRIFAKLDPLLEDNHFDLMLVQGDTTTVMVAALASFYRAIPIGHVEAGLRTYDMRRPFPEELNRVVTSLVSRIHFAPTTRAQKNLLREGISPASVHVTGNTVVDALFSIADREWPCPFPANAQRRLILVTAHRRENFGAPLDSICDAIRSLQEKRDDIEFVYPVHPNPNVHEPVHRALGGLSRIHLIPPADYQEIVALMKRARFILTDSGGIQEEAPALGKPVLVLRSETERLEAVEAGVARVVGTDRQTIIAAVDQLLDDEEVYSRMSRGGSPYGDGKAAERIVALCQAFLKNAESAISSAIGTHKLTVAR